MQRFFAGDFRPLKNSLRLDGFLGVLLLAMAGFQFFLVARYGVDVPYADDWDLLLLRQPSSPWGWIASDHGQHRIFWTRLQVAALYNFNGWNISTHLLFNQVLLWAAVGSFLWVLGHGRVWATLPLLFLFGQEMPGFHSWAIVSHYSFTVFFLGWTAFFLFGRETRYAPGVLCALATLLSSAVGVGAIIGLLFAWFFLKSSREKRPFFVPGILFVALLLWFWSAETPANLRSASYPWSLDFWNGMSLALSRGLFMHVPHPVVRVGLVLWVLSPLLLFARYDLRRHQVPLCLYFSLLSAFAMICVGRAHLEMFVPRYFMLGAFLMAMSGWFWVETLPSVRWAVVVVFLAVLGWSYRKPLRYARAYKHIGLGRLSGEDCVAKIIKNKNIEQSLPCPQLHFNLKPQTIRNAEQMKFSFTQ